jgi:hypothetical protein
MGSSWGFDFYNDILMIAKWREVLMDDFGGVQIWFWE